MQMGKDSGPEQGFSRQMDPNLHGGGTSYLFRVPRTTRVESHYVQENNDLKDVQPKRNPTCGCSIARPAISAGPSME
jgi:hypothetical protein